MTNNGLDERIIEEIKRMSEAGELACLKSLFIAIPDVSKLTLYRHVSYLIEIKKLYYLDVRTNGRVYKALYTEDPNAPMTSEQGKEIISKIDKIYDLLCRNE